MIPRRIVLLTGVALVASPSRLRASDARALRFPLAFSVARIAGAPVVSPEWLIAQITFANGLFDPYGVQFERRDGPPPPLTAVETRADRDVLAAAADPTCIHAFVVESLRDVDDTSRFRRGVHWRLRTRPARRCIVLSSIAEPFVLAHELGHYFGNPHVATPGNIMSYAPTDGPRVFDATQGARIRAAAAALEGELNPRR